MPANGGTVSGQNSESPSPAAPSFARDVFLSYASQDAAIANSVVETLERNSITCWIAPRDVSAGEFYADAIVQAIDASRVLVLILSQHAAASPHILREVERASAKRHLVISLRIGISPLPSGLEYFLNTSQWLDANQGEFRSALPKLIEAVRRAQQGAAIHMAASASQSLQTQSPSPAPTSKTLIAIISTLIIGVVLAFAIDKLWLSKHTENASKSAAPISPPITPAVLAVPDKSVAVLPFVDMSEKKDQEYFSDGMSEELIDMLTKIPELRVPARTSSFYFKDKPTTIADIARTLGVAYVLEGSVRKAGNTLRISAQLIRVDTGYHLWSQTFDRQLGDVFKVQDDIAGAVVDALKISLMGQPLPNTAGTQSVEAYNLYLQAAAMHQEAKNPSDHEKVVAYLRKALTIDPNFANAWALLSNSLSTQLEYKYVSATQIGDEPRRAAEQAVKLNPKLSYAHTALARVYLVYDWDIYQGELQLTQALALDPNDQWALSWAATLAGRRGQFDQAIELIQKSINSDPVNPYRHSDLAGILYEAKRYDEALVANRKCLDLNPSLRECQTLPVFISLAKRDPAAALSVIESDKDLRENCGCRALAYDELGRKSDADAVLDKLEKSPPGADPYETAVVYANRGELDQAFKWLDRAYQKRDNALMEAKVDPLLKNVQSDPRFTQLLKKLGF